MQVMVDNCECKVIYASYCCRQKNGTYFPVGHIGDPVEGGEHQTGAGEGDAESGSQEVEG